MKVTGVFKLADTVIEVGAGKVIFEAGDQGDQMFGVIEGQVEVRTPGGHTRTLDADDTFGELSIIDGSPRSATAVAVVDTKLAVIDRRTFLYLVHETPMFALQVMASIAGRLKSYD